MIKPPTMMLSASDRSVSWYGLIPVHSRNASAARYGHAKMRCIAPPAAPSLLRGGGMSRTLAASCSRSASRLSVTSPSQTSSLTRVRLEADHDVAEAAARGLIDDLLALGDPHERGAERRRDRDGARARRLLLGVLGQEVRLVLLVVVVDRANGHEHPRTDGIGLGWRPDCVRVTEHLLELADLRLHQPLLVLGGVVLRVLSDVAVLSRDLDALGDVRAPVLDQIGKL